MVLRGPCAVPGCPDPTNASGQWQLIQEAGLNALGLGGEELQSCKKADCLRKAKLKPDKQAPGRKRKIDDAPCVEGRVVGRLPPLYIDRIIEIKGCRFASPVLSQAQWRLLLPLLTGAMPLALRYDPVDCERASTDETTLEARRNTVTEPLSSVVQYKVHGWFKNKPEDAGWGDTFYLTMDELCDQLPRQAVQTALTSYRETAEAADMDALDAYDAHDD